MGDPDWEGVAEPLAVAEAEAVDDCEAVADALPLPDSDGVVDGVAVGGWLLDWLCVCVRRCDLLDDAEGVRAWLPEPVWLLVGPELDVAAWLRVCDCVPLGVVVVVRDCVSDADVVGELVTAAELDDDCEGVPDALGVTAPLRVPVPDGVSVSLAVAERVSLRDGLGACDREPVAVSVPEGVRVWLVVCEDVRDALGDLVALGVPVPLAVSVALALCVDEDVPELLRVASCDGVVDAVGGGDGVCV